MQFLPLEVFVNECILGSPQGCRDLGLFRHLSQRAEPFAVNHLFYPLWSGEYLCQRPYCVDRDWLDAFLFFYIEEGTLYFRYRGREFAAGPGDLVLLDCKYHNLYWAEEPVRFGWFHFGGGPLPGLYRHALGAARAALFRLPFWHLTV